MNRFTESRAYEISFKMLGDDDLQDPQIPLGGANNPARMAKPHTSVRYCIITPCRDEERFIARTIDSVLNQTIRPTEWIIVDDGSTDGTAAIVDRYAKEYSWIRTLHRKNRGYRSNSGGVKAFLDAYSFLHSGDWLFLVNLDGDLTFASDYFERCFDRFRSMPCLGIAGGTIYDKVGDDLRLESSPVFHVRGGTKIYRRKCWDQLGDLWPDLAWDTIDELRANQLGWTTQTFSDLHLVHHRAAGSVWGRWGHAVNEGEADYIVGYHPLFFSVKCVRHLFNSPYLLRGLGIAYGFLQATVRHRPRMEDLQLRAYLRKQQLRRLVGLSSIWK
jgi:poly-beta-1,6-N-acetyl-D-glucosamine synthase